MRSSLKSCRSVMGTDPRVCSSTSPWRTTTPRKQAAPSVAGFAASSSPTSASQAWRWVILPAIGDIGRISNSSFRSGSPSVPLRCAAFSDIWTPKPTRYRFNGSTPTTSRISSADSMITAGVIGESRQQRSSIAGPPGRSRPSADSGSTPIS